MKICIIRPPKLMVEGTRPIDVIPPLGIALIGAVLKQAGYTVSAIDAIAQHNGQIQSETIPVYSTRVPQGYRLVTMGSSFAQVAQMIEPDTDVIAISAMFSINWPADRALIKYLAPLFPKAVFIAGGESITGMAAQCLKQVPELTACVLGEGEETVTELLEAIRNKTPLDNVAGIMFLRNGHAVKTQSRARIRELDSIPFPAWELLPVANYKRHSIVEGEESRITLSIIATRGCPYECTFCTSPDMWGTRYFMRKPQNVVDEIEYVRNNFGATNFEFFDLTAIIQKRWIIEFAKLLIDRKLNITWKIPAGTRSEAIDAEVAYYLKASGCYFITYAPESGSPRLLELIKKKVSLPNILTSMSHSKSQGMLVYINMILGLPDETHRDVWNTFKFLAQAGMHGVDDMPLAVFRPYPGSALFDRLLAEGKIQLDNDDYIIDSIFIIDTITEQQYYNHNISPFWYKIYYVLAYVFFYTAGYLYSPIRLLQDIGNLINKGKLATRHTVTAPTITDSASIFNRPVTTR